jgi:signal transduction histidine kinase
MLQEDLKDKISEADMDLMKLIKDSSEYMLELVNNLLDVSKIESGKLIINPREVDIDKLIRKVIQINSRIAEKKNISIQFNSPDTSLKGVIDPAQIEQVLNNLITNAIKFSNANTAIDIEAKRTDGYISIAVKDHGQGIPEKDMDKLFKFFSRTSVQSTAGESSHGLGLAISKKIVDAHGGSITVESKEGVGSTFSFLLKV